MTTNLGALITTEQNKDAIHVAIAPVAAAEKLSPGDHVGLNPDGTASEAITPIGVVDPFLKKNVKPGEKFWLLLYPNTITALRHEWTHPAFAAAQVTVDAKAYSEQWLRNYAAKLSSYDDPETAYSNLMEGLKLGTIYAHGSDLHGLYDLDDADELRKHAEAVLGIRIDWGTFEFSCSC